MATVVLLQAKDSSYISSAISDTLGFFRMNNLPSGNYILQVQHLAFDKLVLPLSLGNGKVLPDTLFLKSNAVNISEVSVKAHRPVVKMIDNRLVYNTTQMNQLKTEDNAFGMLKNIPGLLVQDDKIGLIGSSKLNLMINGLLSSLSTENIIAMLKSIPASRVKEVQLMYSAPAQYNVTGSLVNIILKDNESSTPNWQGEFTLGASQGVYTNEFGRANLLYSSNKFNTEMLYNGSNTKEEQGIDFSVKHLLNNNNYFISQNINDIQKSNDHLLQLNTHYKTDKKDDLSLAYTFNYTRAIPDGQTQSRFAGKDIPSTSSLTNTSKNEDIYLHNIKLQFDSHAKFKLGGDYTFYHDPSEQTFSEAGANSETKFRTNSGQSIHKGILSFSVNDSLLGCNINYGLNSTFSHNTNNYSFLQLKSGNFVPDTSNVKDTKIEEFTSTPFINVTRSLSEKLSLQIGLKGEYYTMKDKTSDSKTLWERFDVYPNLDLSYIVNDKNMLQLSFNSYTTYPTYWSINPVSSYSSSYTIISGNRYLKPSRTYSGQLNYIFCQKYSLTAFYERNNDYLIQLPYQLSNALNLVYRFENVDQMSIAGFSVVVPFKIGKVVSSSAVVNAFRMTEKDDNFYEMSFNRSCNSFDFVLNNSIVLSQKPALNLDITGYYTYDRIQGIYNIGSTYDVSCGLKWSFAQSRASLLLKVKDLFNANMPVTQVRYRNQYSDQKYDYDTRRLSLSFTYRFGGYQQKSKVEIDKSRFSRN
jgi:hypothetical protein